MGDPDELIRLIQRKKAPVVLPVSGPKTVAPATAPGYGVPLTPAMSPFMQALMDTVLGVANTPVPVAPPVFDNAGVHGSIIAAALGSAAPVAAASAPPLTEAEILREIERRQKIAQVRYRIRHWNDDVFTVERTYEVPCSKILWSIPLPGDREREVVQCAAGHEVTAPAPWGDGTARGDLGHYPCFIFGFSFISQDGGVSMVNWPQGFTKN